MAKAKRSTNLIPCELVDGAILQIDPWRLVFGWNSRRTEDDDSDGLTESLIENTMLQAPIVRPIETEHGPALEVVAGKRRVMRARRLGWKVIEVKVRRLDDVRAMFVNVTENTGRKNLAAWELAECCADIHDRTGHGHIAIAKAIGKDSSYVLWLIESAKQLHPDIWAQVKEWGRSCRIGWHELAAIARLPRDEQIAAWLARIDPEKRSFKRAHKAGPGRAKLLHALCMLDEIPRSAEWRRGAAYALKFALGREAWQYKISRTVPHAEGGETAD